MKTRAGIVLGSAILVIAAATTTGAPAQARATWEVAQAPSLQINETFFMHKHVAGHPGNWHMMQVYVEQDDSQVGGGIEDFRCPAGKAPAANRHDDCTQVGGYQFDDEQGLTVVWTRALHTVRIKGKILLEDYFDTGDLRPAKVDLRLRAAGKHTRTVTSTGPTATDPNSYKRIDIRRGLPVTAHGHVAWLTATPAQVTDTEALHAYWILSRGA